MGSRDIRIVEKELIAIEETRRFFEPPHQIIDGVRSRGGKSQMAGASQDHGAFLVVKRTHALAALRHNR